MTAHAMQGDQQKCLEAGMDDYLSKPVDAKTLKKMLERWLPSNHTLKSNAKELKGPQKSAADYTWNRKLLQDNIGGNEESLREVIGIFLEDAPRLITVIEKSLEEDDLEKLAITAHSLKGAARNFTAEKLAEFATLIEFAGKRGAPSKIPEYLLNLKKEFENINKTARREI
jgi:HPt (histidine-containing phosphotransfer) domain-containing protein